MQNLSLYMQLVMPKMSQQLAIAALASTLSLAALALSAPALHSPAGGGESLLPSIAQMPAVQLPALPTIVR